MVCDLVHQMQLFQQEMLHFSSNLEYYVKTRAIQSVCNQLSAKLKEITTEFSEEKSGTSDMDSLIQIHNDYLKNIMKLCLLHQSDRSFLELILNLL